MPPKTATVKAVSKGAGMTAGLEIVSIIQGTTTKFVLVDKTEGRFAEDVKSWNDAAGLNAAALKKLKDATK